MKIWLDDVRNKPDDTWTHCKSVNEAITTISNIDIDDIEEFSLDHDLGDYYEHGGDGIKVVLWMAENNKWPQKIYVHSANPVGVRNMLEIIDRYGPYTKKDTLRGRIK